MSNPNTITFNKRENIAQEVLSSSEIQSSIKQDLEGINERLTNPIILQSLEKVFSETTENEIIDLSKLTPQQIEKLKAIQFLLSGQKSDNKSIIENAKSAQRQAWIGKHDSDSLDSPWYVTPNNYLQGVFTGPAISAAAIAMTGAPAIPALIGGYAASAAGYMGLDKFTHKMDRTPLPSDNKLRSNMVRGRMAIAAVGAAFSASLSVAGGLLIPATFNNPQFKVQAEMIKSEKIEKSIETTTNALESAKAALAESNPTYKSLVEKRDELSTRLTKETAGVKEIEERLKKGGLSESQIKELNRQRQNYLAHIGTGKFSNQKQLDDFNARIEAIEKSNPALVKAKYGLSSINELKANTPGAWEKDKDGKLNRLDALKILAKDQGIAAEAVQPISEGNLSSVQMEKIARESLEDMSDLTSKGLTAFALAIEALVLMGRLGNYSNKRKQMLLTEDFQDGLKQIGEGFTLEFQKLMSPPNLPSDRSLWTKQDSKVYRDYIKNQDILGKVFSSSEFVLAVKIMAARKQNNLGAAMSRFENEYSETFNESESRETNQKKVAQFEQSVQNAMVASDTQKLLEELRRGINQVGIYKASEDSNGFKRAAINAKRIITNPLNNLKNGKNERETMRKKILPANSILSVIESLKDSKIKEVLKLKIAQALLRHFNNNPGTNYTKAKVIEIANLPESNFSDEEKQIIETSLEEMNFTEHKKKVREIKSKFVEELYKIQGYKDIEKAISKMKSELAKTVNTLEDSIDMQNTDLTIVSYRDNLKIISSKTFVALEENVFTYFEGMITLIARINENYDKPFDITTDPIYVGIIDKGGDHNAAILQKIFPTPPTAILQPQTPDPVVATNP